MKPILSVITPASRGVKDLTQLMRDFKNQTLPTSMWEWVCVYDGKPPQDVAELFRTKKMSNTKFVSIKKDMGNMRIAPGTRPRNYGLSISLGNFVCFFDDDDRAKSTYLESLCWGIQENMISVVQMACSEKRIRRNGDPNKISVIPEAGLPYFPIPCHVGTPCFCVPRPWALDNPWQHEPEHDYHFIRRIVEKYRPQIRFQGGIQIDVDGLFTKNLRDWVTKPPFFRGDL